MMLARALADPQLVLALDHAGWAALLSAAHAERLLPTLAHRLTGLAMPENAAAVLENARLHAATGRVRTLWEIEMARRALAALDLPVVLLKGSAFIAAGLEAGQGRLIGDLDILVPRDRLAEVERAVLQAGWEWLTNDQYDDAYYRRWMHELPPLIHRDRDAMIDIHHTILPLTARPKPDATAMIANSVCLENGLRILSPADMIIHAAAHLLADGDLAGGLRNLWDIRCLTTEYPTDDLRDRARQHGLVDEVDRAMRLVAIIFDETEHKPLRDRFYVARLSARDGWGRETHKLLRFVFYVRSHLIRMPFLLLIRHLFTKWRRAKPSA